MLSTDRTTNTSKCLRAGRKRSFTANTVTNLTSKKLKDWYPSGSVPSLELLRKTIGDLEAEQKQKKQFYTQTADETETLSKSLQKIEQYLGNEQERAEEEQRRKRKKSGDLE